MLLLKHRFKRMDDSLLLKAGILFDKIFYLWYDLVTQLKPRLDKLSIIASCIVITLVFYNSRWHGAFYLTKILKCVIMK